MTSEQQELLESLDEFHAQARAVILHGGPPTGAAAAGFNLANFLKNAVLIFNAVWPILQPLLAGAVATHATPDPAIPAKA